LNQRFRLLSGRPTVPPEGAGFEQLVLPHLDAAHNVARWLVRDASLAEDVTQDAMLRALRYYPSFRGGDARAWLIRIVRNTALSALAARKHAAASLDSDPADRDGPPAEDVADDADDPEAALARRQDGKRLERALSALPMELRECLVLRELEGLAYHQIAQVTAVPVGTVMSRLWRARRALMMEGRGG
jgi:RNA polymerase sigma factor (sigma-70 family)